jgi:hypothetical protein
LQQGRRQLAHQLQHLGDAYQAGVMPLAEYQQRREALERQQVVLERQQLEVEARVDQQQALAQVTTSLLDFCERVQHRLARATFDQRRQRVELLIECVVVTHDEIEIHCVLPTTPASEHSRYCHLHTDYQHRLPGWETARQMAPRTAPTQDIKDGVEDAAEGMASCSAVATRLAQMVLPAVPLAIGEVA